MQTEDTVFMLNLMPLQNLILITKYTVKVMESMLVMELFNHESSSLEFVTRKISNNVAQICLGLKKQLCLGTFRCRIKYAPDYVEGCGLCCRKTFDDYVIATGEDIALKNLWQYLMLWAC